LSDQPVGPAATCRGNSRIGAWVAMRVQLSSASAST
jgi:hypothetical protein